MTPNSPLFRLLKWHLERGFAAFGAMPTTRSPKFNPLAQKNTAAKNPILLAELLAAGEPPDAECLEWLRVGFKRFLRGAGPADVCLRLTGASRIAARNTALIRAARMIDGGQGISAWQLAELLRQAVVRFRDVTMQRIQRGDAGELTPVQTALSDAFASGAMPLTSRQRLYDLLSNCQ